MKSRTELSEGTNDSLAQAIEMGARLATTPEEFAAQRKRGVPVTSDSARHFSTVVLSSNVDILLSHIARRRVSSNAYPLRHHRPPFFLGKSIHVSSLESRVQSSDLALLLALIVKRETLFGRLPERFGRGSEHPCLLGHRVS